MQGAVQTQGILATEDSTERCTSGTEQWIQKTAVVGAKWYQISLPLREGDWLGAILERDESELINNCWLHLAAPSSIQAHRRLAGLLQIEWSGSSLTARNQPKLQKK